jgi:N-acetylglucosamine-6-phosphate deacetylase
VSRGAAPGVIRGRIPGRPGLWELERDNDRITRLDCRDESFSEVRCRWITPGLFDLQVNGIGGIHFTDPSLTTDQAARADALIRDSGASRYCPTVITCALQTAKTVLAVLARAREDGRIPGARAVHLEGPWLSDADGARGIHRREHIRDVSLSEWAALQEAAGGWIGIVTLAPERSGALELIRQAAAAGIVVSLGHTEASPEEIGAAVDAGAAMSTHLFNGCARMLGRHSNVVFSQLAEDGLRACFIADGHHVPFPTLRIGIRTKGVARSVLVSDLAHLSGLPEGEYEMEGNLVELRDGGLRVKDSNVLSGAARTLAEDVQWLARQPEPGIEAALLMATCNPAEAMGDRSWSDLRPGRQGPIAVFSWNGEHLQLEERIGF